VLGLDGLSPIGVWDVLGGGDAWWAWNQLVPVGY